MTKEEKQSRYPIARLIQGECPVHGVAMIPAHADSGNLPPLYCCPCLDCTVTVTESAAGTLQLSPEFAYLLAGQSSPN